MKEEELIRQHHAMLAPVFAGFECEPGWFPLIATTLTALRDAAPNARIMRVKEKIGTSRIRLADPLDPVASAIVYRAEQQSASICDICGSVGVTIRAGGPVRTRCPQHEHIL